MTVYLVSSGPGCNECTGSESVRKVFLSEENANNFAKELEREGSYYNRYVNVESFEVEE